MANKSALQLLSEYNQLMNQRLFDSATLLTVTELSQDKGAFFKSVLGSLNHLLVGDIIWLQRFAQHPSSEIELAYISTLTPPPSLDTILFKDLQSLKIERQKIDNIIIHWIKALVESDLDAVISYLDMAGVKHSKNFACLIHHLFLHQVHHRGQITTLLSQSGIDFGDTDLLELISEIDTSTDINCQ